MNVSGSIESNEKGGVLKSGLIRIYDKKTKNLLLEHYTETGLFNLIIENPKKI